MMNLATDRSLRPLEREDFVEVDPVTTRTS